MLTAIKTNEIDTRLIALYGEKYSLHLTNSAVIQFLSLSKFLLRVIFVETLYDQPIEVINIP